MMTEEKMISKEISSSSVQQQKRRPLKRYLDCDPRADATASGSRSDNYHHHHTINIKPMMKEDIFMLEKKTDYHNSANSELVMKNTAQKVQNVNRIINNRRMSSMATIHDSNGDDYGEHNNRGNFYYWYWY